MKTINTPNFGFLSPFSHKDPTQRASAQGNIYEPNSNTPLTLKKPQNQTLFF